MMEAVYSSNISVVPADAKDFNSVLSQLKKFGFLLESDPRLPSVTAIVTGSPLTSSWWSHPLAHTIFHVNGQLEDHPDVLVAKLVASKVTFIHKKLWPDILAIGTARERWQTEALSAPAVALLKTIDANGCLRTDDIVLPASKTSSKKPKPGDLARELERKLLVKAAQFHTETGAHAKFLETWEHWTNRIGFVTEPLPVAEAKRRIESRLRKLNQQYNAAARLPWEE